jgi:DNA-directed RNA polymerase subunit N (RpoN/RPB10)
MREPEDAAPVRRDLHRHAFAHAAEPVEFVMAEQFEIALDRLGIVEACCREVSRRHYALQWGMFRIGQRMAIIVDRGRPP